MILRGPRCKIVEWAAFLVTEGFSTHEYHKRGFPDMLVPLKCNKQNSTEFDAATPLDPEWSSLGARCDDRNSQKQFVLTCSSSMVKVAFLDRVVFFSSFIYQEN